MSPGILIVVGVVLAVTVVLVLLRKKLKLNRDMPKGAAVGLIVVAVLIAGAVEYWLVLGPKPAPPPAEGGGMGMMMGPPGGMQGQPGGPGGMQGQPGGPGGRLEGRTREPSPARDLARFVRKVAELQKQNVDVFSAEQKTALVPVLQQLLAAEKLPDTTAGETDAAIKAILSAEQAAAADAVELPRRSWGDGPDGAGGPGGDWRAAMRERLLEIPSIKTAYDAKVAEDPTFAQDDDDVGQFLRELMRELSPFQHGSTKEATEALLAALGG